MIDITVFTPTFNRADLLPRLYDSLKNQTLYNFMWLIIDDGSTDNTEDIINNMIKSTNEFEIKYIKKENGGLHTGYNVAIENLTTQLAMCIDSDDFMPPKAIEIISDFWNKNGSNNFAGIVGLDIYQDEKVIGDLLPNVKNINLIDLLIGKYKINNGDRKLVVRSDLYKKVAPQPTINGEKNFNPHYMHLQISKEYDFLVLNEPLCVVDYQLDGMTGNIFNQYCNSPNSFIEIRKLYFSFKNTPLKFKIKNYLHYVSSCILAHKSISYKNIPNKFLLTLILPFGLLFSIYVRYKAK